MKRNPAGDCGEGCFQQQLSDQNSKVEEEVIVSLRNKPEVPHRKTLSPSSFYNIRCPRCLWLEYWHGFKLPANLALQLQLSRLQEAAYDGVDSSVVSSKLPKGYVTKHKKRFTSQPVKINGEETRWKIYGEIDLLVHHEDGTYSIVDGKVSMKKDEDALIESYWTQLEAYVFAFENPLEGDPMPIKSIGLLQWRIDNSLHLDGDLRGFSVEHRFIQLPRREKEFQEFLARFIAIIEGDILQSGTECENCEFFMKIGFTH